VSLESEKSGPTGPYRVPNIFLKKNNLGEHFHQKIRQHAIVIGGTTVHLLIYRTFSS